MIKFNQGYVINEATGKRRNIVVKSATANTFKDILIGGSMVLVGIVYLTVKAFKNGSQKYEDAEFQALCDAGVVTEYGAEFEYLKKR